MFRRGKWDLPKGKLDPGETLEACALREVREETGVGQLELIKFLLVTEHEYEESGIVDFERNPLVSDESQQSSETDSANRRRYFRIKMDEACGF